MQIEPFKLKRRRPFAVENFLEIIAALLLFVAACCFPRATNGQAAGFHDAPAAASKTKNPLAGKADAAQAGADLYAKKCALCHGDKGQGVGNIPALAKNPTQAATDALCKANGYESGRSLDTRTQAYCPPPQIKLSGPLPKLTECVFVTRAICR